MADAHPVVIALAGPNGAGKSTSGPALLRDALGVNEFVNADVIARGLSAFNPEGAAMTAGRTLLARVRDLARMRATFAFETTLSGRSYAPWLARLIRNGYAFHLVFLWLPGADFAVSRVADRVRLGGHAIPEDTIRRRYVAGLSNFFRLYRPLASTWRMYDNSSSASPRLISIGQGPTVTHVMDARVWARICGGRSREKGQAQGYR